MAQVSSIEWTEATWNPTTGCDKISAGCDHCYALTLARRLKAMGNPKYQSDGNPTTSGPGFGVAIHPDSLGVPYTWRQPRLVFVNSMSDLFHARIPTSFIADVFAVMAGNPRHTFQLLTKRPKRLADLADRLTWAPNIWAGVTVEDPRTCWRVGHLVRTPAAVRFVSAEPLLAPLPELDLHGIDWVIAGGESGPGHRPLNVDSARQLRDRCVEAGVAFFFKQHGGTRPKSGGRLLDGRHWDEMPTADASRLEQVAFQPSGV